MSRQTVSVDEVVPDLRQWIRPGDTVAWGQANAEPLLLTRALAEQRAALGGIRCFVGIGSHGTFDASMAQAIQFVSYCGSGTNRHLGSSLDILPCAYSEIPRLILSGHLRVDVLLLKISQRDELGRYSYGLAADYLAAAREKARVVIAQVDAASPWTYGERCMVRDDFDLIVEGGTSAATEEAETARQPSEAEAAIGRRVAGLVEDGSTLQVGIGNVPDAALAALTGHRHLGLHTGAAGDAIVALTQSGALNNTRKELDRGASVAGLLIGSSVLSQFAHRNPRLRIRRTEYTHDPQVLASQPRLVAINSAIEVDLTGQINAEVAGDRYIGAVGGSSEFLRAARASRGGIPIIALPSTASGRSRIVARLSGPVTTSRSDAGVIVTEHGVADLRGLCLARRVERMLEICAPQFRGELAAQAEAVLRNDYSRLQTSFATT